MVYFFLGTYHVGRADGSTRILCYRARALEEAQIPTRWVAPSGLGHLEGFDYQPVFEEWPAFCKHIRALDHAANLYITSWDEVLVAMRKAGLPAARCVLYAQSEHVNRRFDLAHWSVAVSDYAQAALQRSTGARISIVIPNGIDIAAIAPYRALDKCERGICTAALNRDEELRRAFSERCALPLTVLPVLPQREFWQAVARFRFYLNHHRYEGFGLPVLEAMALGTVPVILFRHGATAFANSENCLGLSDDPVQAAEHVNALTEAEYRRLQENGLRTAQQWDIRESNSRFVAWVRELLAQPYEKPRRRWLWH